MSIRAERGLNISSAARLISFPQAAGQICVSFWYHIFGNSIGMLFLHLQCCFVNLILILVKYSSCICLQSGSLKFITKYSGEEERTVWIRTGTQGNKWRFTDLTFSSAKPIQVILFIVCLLISPFLAQKVSRLIGYCFFL